MVNVNRATRPEAWSATENQQIIQAYMEMLRSELAGLEYVKAEVNRSLQPQLQNRSHGSIEYKFQNISAVLYELGLPYVSGYKPATNYQRSLQAPVLAAAEAAGIYSPDADLQPTADPVELDKRVQRLRHRGLDTVPPGEQVPEQHQVTRSERMRNPAVKAWVLQSANGVCELCDQPGPFELADGTRYLEVHHVVPLAEGGADIVSNAVALCPNCHRWLHLGVDRIKQESSLQKKVSRLRGSGND